jgi:uncharacterized membrane protein
MPQFPPFPTWDSLHPMIIHFPIVLLLVSPLFLLISAAAASGEAAGRLAERGGPVDAVLESHEDLATQSEVIFSVLSVVMLGIVALPRILRREETRLTTTWIPLSFLVLYCVGILFVVNTAHAGGRLVHEFGVHAIIPAENNHSIALPDVHESARMDEAK